MAKGALLIVDFKDNVAAITVIAVTAVGIFASLAASRDVRADYTAATPVAIQKMEPIVVIATRDDVIRMDTILVTSTRDSKTVIAAN